MVVEKEMIDEKDLASAFWNGQRNGKKIWKIVKDENGKYTILYSKYDNSTTELDMKHNFGSLVNNFMSLNTKTKILQIFVQKVLFTYDEVQMISHLFDLLNSDLNDYIISNMTIQYSLIQENKYIVKLVLTFKNGKIIEVPFYTGINLYLNSYENTEYELNKLIRKYDLDKDELINEELIRGEKK